MASITLSAIAQQLGTSTVTVSNALNGKGVISPELRQKIIQTAQELGYQRRTKAKAVAPRAEGAQGHAHKLKKVRKYALALILGQSLIEPCLW